MEPWVEILGQRMRSAGYSDTQIDQAAHWARTVGVTLTSGRMAANLPARPLRVVVGGAEVEPANP